MWRSQGRTQLDVRQIVGAGPGTGVFNVVVAGHVLGDDGETE